MRFLYKKTVLCILSLLIMNAIFAQQIQKEFDASNITIKDSSLTSFIDGLYKYFLTQTNHFNYADYFVWVSVDNRHDSNYAHVEAFFQPWE